MSTNEDDITRDIEAIKSSLLEISTTVEKEEISAEKLGWLWFCSRTLQVIEDLIVLRQAKTDLSLTMLSRAINETERNLLFIYNEKKEKKEKGNPTGIKLAFKKFVTWTLWKDYEFTEHKIKPDIIDKLYDSSFTQRIIDNENEFGVFKFTQGLETDQKKLNALKERDTKYYEIRLFDILKVIKSIGAESEWEYLQKKGNISLSSFITGKNLTTVEKELKEFDVDVFIEAHYWQSRVVHGSTLENHLNIDDSLYTMKVYLDNNTRAIEDIFDSIFVTFCFLIHIASKFGWYKQN